MRCRSRPPVWLSTGMLVAACLAGASPVLASPEQPSVLILLPGQPGLPAASAVTSGLRAVLLAEWAFRVSIEMEHVDVARFASPETEERRLRAIYTSKYGDQRFDLIVAALPEPFRFVLRARDDLWPGVPVVVCGIDERARDLTPPPGVAVLTIRFDMEGTVRAARALLPGTRHVALVGGASGPEQVYHDLIRQAVSSAGALDVIDLTKLPIGDVLARVSSLPEHTVIMQSSYQVDGAGRRFHGIDLLPQVSSAANRPVFTPLGLALGRGVVGGSIIDFEEIGRDAGRLASRILRGEAPPSAPVPSRATGVPRFDARALARWGLDERRLPPGSEVLYRQESLWQQYRWHIAVTLGVIAAQAGLIVTLLVLRRRRREVQARLAERLRFEALMNEVAAACSAPGATLDEPIRDSLRRVATFLGVDRAALWQPSSDPSVIAATHVWNRQGAGAPPAVIDLREVPYFRRRVDSAAGALSFSRLDDLPPEAAAERAAFATGGIRSFVAIPLYAGTRMLGILAFVSVNEERAWTDDLVQQLHTLAGHFAHAIARVQSAAALESSTALTGAVLSALPGETAIIDAKGTIVHTNDAWAGASAGPALSAGANYLDACRAAIGMPAEVARKVHVSIEAVLRGEDEEFAVEYPSLRRGEHRWLELRVQRLAHLGGGAAVTHIDVTSRRQAEAAARRHLSDIAHLDRVAGMGQLGSSIAHELNQPLTAILANAQAASRLLAQAHPDLAELRACLVDIISDDQRAAEVIRRMRRLLKKTDFRPLPLALNDLIANTLGLVANDALLHAVSLEFHPAAALPIVYGDLVQIQQVVLNLLSNAITAAAGRTIRRVEVSTALVAPYVEVVVHDSGEGIAEDDLDRLFEPFFTTKPDGLGMGLAISRAIIEAHGGRLLAENDPAGGAVFRVHLRADKPEEP